MFSSFVFSKIYQKSKQGMVNEEFGVKNTRIEEFMLAFKDEI